ncbi:hypothetical protein BDQ17DRAFT_1439458 [Cyathus striatus]|nr:hypothetical protein BDQ17DRAFT_1439458 [Cyathus striatus]
MPLDPPKGPHYSSQTTPVPPSHCPTYVSPPNSQTHPTYQVPDRATIYSPPWHESQFQQEAYTKTPMSQCELSHRLDSQLTALYMKPESPRWKDLNLEDGLGQDNAGVGNEKKKGGTQSTNSKGKAGSRKKPTVGRPMGVHGFSATEITKLLHLIKAIKPIGQDGWDTVVKLYMKWAKEKGYAMRDRTSLRQKFDRTVKSAKSKPTGATKRDKSTVFGLALECSSLIEDKSGRAVFMDSEGEDDEPNNNDIALESDEDVIATTEDSDSHAVNLTEDIDDETEITPESPPSRKNKKAIIKTDENSGGIRPLWGAQATDTLAAISSYFNPVAVQQCDDIREETTHAIRAEAKLEVIQMQLPPQHGSPLNTDLRNFNPTSSTFSGDLKH